MAKAKKRTGGIFMNNEEFVIAGTTYFDECEWCIQFDDDEPNIFAVGDASMGLPKITFSLSNRSDCNIIFFDERTNKKLKIFTRKKTK
jgi:hypothetical protein